MNLQRKIDLQERKMKSMQSQIEKLESENSALRFKNKELTDKELKFQQQLQVIEEVRSEYEACIADAIRTKESCEQIIAEAQHIKKEYTKKFRQLLGRMK